jgi:hypothetical protein
VAGGKHDKTRTNDTARAWRRTEGLGGGERSEGAEAAHDVDTEPLGRSRDAQLLHHVELDTGRLNCKDNNNNDRCDEDASTHEQCVYARAVRTAGAGDRDDVSDVLGVAAPVSHGVLASRDRELGRLLAVSPGWIDVSGRPVMTQQNVCVAVRERGTHLLRTVMVGTVLGKSWGRSFHSSLGFTGSAEQK